MSASIEEVIDEIRSLWGFHPYDYTEEVNKRFESDSKIKVKCKKCGFVMRKTLHGFLTLAEEKGYYCEQCMSHDEQVEDTTIVPATEADSKYDELFVSDAFLKQAILEKYGNIPYMVHNQNAVEKWWELTHDVCGTKFIARPTELLEHPVRVDAYDPTKTIEIPFCPHCNGLFDLQNRNTYGERAVKAVTFAFEKAGIPKRYHFPDVSVYRLKNYNQPLTFHCADCGEEFIATVNALLDVTKHACTKCKGRNLKDSATNQLFEAELKDEASKEIQTDEQYDTDNTITEDVVSDEIEGYVDVTGEPDGADEYPPPDNFTVNPPVEYMNTEIPLDSTGSFEQDIPESNEMSDEEYVNSVFAGMEESMEYEEESPDIQAASYEYPAEESEEEYDADDVINDASSGEFDSENDNISSNCEDTVVDDVIEQYEIIDDASCYGIEPVTTECTSTIRKQETKVTKKDRPPVVAEVLSVNVFENIEPNMRDIYSQGDNMSQHPGNRTTPPLPPNNNKTGSTCPQGTPNAGNTGARKGLNPENTRTASGAAPAGGYSRGGFRTAQNNNNRGHNPNSNAAYESQAAIYSRYVGITDIYDITGFRYRFLANDPLGRIITVLGRNYGWDEKSIDIVEDTATGLVTITYGKGKVLYVPADNRYVIDVVSNKGMNPMAGYNPMMGQQFNVFMNFINGVNQVNQYNANIAYQQGTEFTQSDLIEPVVIYGIDIAENKSKLQAAGLRIARAFGPEHIRSMPTTQLVNPYIMGTTLVDSSSSNDKGVHAMVGEFFEQNDPYKCEEAYGHVAALVATPQDPQTFMKMYSQAPNMNPAMMNMGGMQQPMMGYMQQPQMGMNMGMQQPMMGGMNMGMNPQMMGGMQQPMMNMGMQQPMMGGMQQPQMGMNMGMQQPMMGGMNMGMGAIQQPMIGNPMMGGMQQPMGMNPSLPGTNSFGYGSSNKKVLAAIKYTQHEAEGKPVIIEIINYTELATVRVEGGLLYLLASFMSNKITTLSASGKQYPNVEFHFSFGTMPKDIRNDLLQLGNGYGMSAFEGEHCYIGTNLKTGKTVRFGTSVVKPVYLMQMYPDLKNDKDFPKDLSTPDKQRKFDEYVEKYGFIKMMAMPNQRLAININAITQLWAIKYNKDQLEDQYAANPELRIEHERQAAAYARGMNTAQQPGTGRSRRGGNTGYAQQGIPGMQFQHQNPQMMNMGMQPQMGMGMNMGMQQPMGMQPQMGMGMQQPMNGYMQQPQMGMNPQMMGGMQQPMMNMGMQQPMNGYMQQPMMQQGFNAYSRR